MRFSVEKTGAQIVIDFLRHHNVECVFGYPGGAILPIYDEVYKSGIKHILTRHEQGAIHAAEGYARATGKVGVVMATSGPGATNLVTGLADAKMDSVPIIAITGQVATTLIGTDAFQEADIYGISIPVTKHNRLVRSVHDLASYLEEAYVVATSGRPGPVLVDIPKDVQNLSTKNTEFICDPRVIKRFKDLLDIEGDLDGFVKKLNEAKRPLLYVGGGALTSSAHNEVLQLAEKGNIPVAMTLMGLGAFPGTHPLSLGMMGMHGTRYANNAVSNCDMLIALGARFDDRVTGKVDAFAKQATIAHIDIDRAEIGKIVEGHFPIAGDLKTVLQTILSEVKFQPRDEWINMVNDWKKNLPLRYKREKNIIKPQYFLEKLNEITKGNAILSTDVGQHQMWSAQYYNFSHPRSFLTSGGLGTMGFGFPAAIGAKLACPDRPTFVIAGDGSFQMNIQELATASMYGVNVKIVILNNGYLGMVRQWQDIFFEKRFSHVSFDFNPNFVKLADAYGLTGKTITREDEVEEGIQFLLESDKAAILEVMIPEEEKVYPMIPAGATYNDIMDLED